MQLYMNDNDPDQVTNCAAFETFMRRFEWATFFQPNPQKAPWHVQCRVLNGATGNVRVLNFWPHKLKGQYFGPSVEGMAGLCSIMAEAIEDSAEDFVVIE